MKLPDLLFPIAITVSLVIGNPIFTTNVAELVFTSAYYAIAARSSFNSFLALWTDLQIEIDNEGSGVFSDSSPGRQVMTLSWSMMLSSTEKTHHIVALLAFSNIERLFDKKTVRTIWSPTDFYCFA